MRINHKFFSKLALNIAEHNLGKTKDNPSVGCVVVKNNSVISTGLTSVNGRPHAEFNALNKKMNFKNAEVYTSLEPCTHYGLTPPCTNIIKKKKIKKVFYSFNDSDKRTSKKAKAILRKNKIKVKKIYFKKNDFYKSYYLNKTKEIPLVDAKIAISKDNFTIHKKNKWITNRRSRDVAHLLRSKYDSIISTSKSINKDNSLLNCRINGLDNNKPDLIIIDRNLKLKTKLKLFDISKKRKTYIFTTKNNKKKLKYLKNKRLRISIITKLENKKDFQLFFKKIFSLGKRRILVETGLTFLNQLLRLNLVNNLFVFKSDKNIKKNGANNNNLRLIKKYKHNDIVKVDLINDKLFKIRIK